jgi:lipoprotein-anchoring transpeptidase ErfK/SrfK
MRLVCMVVCGAAIALVASTASATPPPVQHIGPDRVQRSWPADAKPVAVAAPSRTGGAMIARVVVGVHTRSKPDGGARGWYAGPATSMSHHPQSLLVLGSAEVKGQEWLKLLLPIRPDGSTGWVPRANVSLSTTQYWIRVVIDQRKVYVFDRGKLIHVDGAVVGKPSTPTPTGLAYIYEKDRQPNPKAFLGPWALPTSLLSDALRHFEGGPGRVALHGRAGASLLDPIGTAASHGCIRIDNSPIDWLAAHVPVGTPVYVEHAQS